MGLEIAITRNAAKDLLTLPNTDRGRVERRVEAYAAAADGPGHDVVPLVGTRGLYRLRSGDLRVVFEIDGGVMRILSVLHRREAYR